MTASESALSSIEALVNGGKAVVTADSSSVVAMMQAAVNSGTSATFYVAPAEAQALMRLYWTPGRIRDTGLEPVSEEERAKIEAELGVEDMGPWFSNRLECGCGGVYGAFEFVDQGLREHGKEWVGVVVGLEGASVVRINPAQDAFCPKCNLLLLRNHWYAMYDRKGTMIYGCCRGEIPRPPVITA